jgi:microcompartment protein CcmL/EutN
MIEPALALIDFSSIAAGIEAADAMVKRAPIDMIRTGTVQPGRYLVLIGGAVADVQESLSAGRAAGGESVLDHVFLPHVHPEVVAAIGGGRVPTATDAVGVIETTTVAASIHAADAGVKGADVKLLEIRMAVEAAVEAGCDAVRPGLLFRQVVIAQLHPEMWENLSEATRFGSRLEGP